VGQASPHRRTISQGPFGRGRWEETYFPEELVTCKNPSYSTDGPRNNQSTSRPTPAQDQAVGLECEQAIIHVSDIDQRVRGGGMC
jgi:hypothetical protein